MGNVHIFGTVPTEEEGTLQFLLERNLPSPSWYNLMHAAMANEGGGAVGMHFNSRLNES